MDIPAGSILVEVTFVLAKFDLSSINERELTRAEIFQFQ